MAAALLLAGLMGKLPPAQDLELALWLGPATGEFVAVHAGSLPYRPGRTLLFGLLLGAGLGRLAHRYLLHPGDPQVWILAACCALPTLWAATVHHRKEKKLVEE